MALLVLALALAALALPPSADAAQQGVTISGDAFSPSSLTVHVGDSVVWTNNDGVGHSSTSDSGVWDTGVISGGGAASSPVTFPTAGTFTYHCKVHSFMTGTVIVQAATHLVASFTANVSGLAVSVDASGSQGDITTYAWTWGDGSQDAGGPQRSHTYASGGAKDITLTVSDATGAQASGSKLVTVSAPDKPPHAAFSFTADGLVAHFDASGSTDADGTIKLYSWTFGDSTPTASGVTVGHAYAAAGNFTVALTVRDDAGLADVARQVVRVAPPPPPNEPPVASFTVARAGLRVAVDASASRDPDGRVASYAWDFGDGGANATGANATHDYAAPGNYTISLVVADDQGATATATRDITLGPPAPRPPATLAVSAMGLHLVADASGSASADDPVRVAAWDFGDGALISCPADCDPAALSIGHDYRRDGAFDVRVRLVDAFGQPEDAAARVLVAGSPPATFRALVEGDLVTLDGSDVPHYAGVSWSWRADGVPLGAGPQLQWRFAPGAHVVTLTLTDDAGALTLTRNVTTTTVATSAATPAQNDSTPSVPAPAPVAPTPAKVPGAGVAGVALALLAAAVRRRR